MSVDTSFSITDTRHPLFQAFGGSVGSFGQVRVGRATRVVEAEGSRVIARFENGHAALVEYPMNQGRAVVFASDLNNEWNDFPRRPTFVPFVHELMRYLTAERDETRDLEVADLPRDLSVQPGPLVLADSGRQVVVNVDSRESDVTQSTQEVFLSHLRVRERADDALASTAPAVASQEAEQGYWWYALLAMVVVLVAEAWLGRTMA